MSPYRSLHRKMSSLELALVDRTVIVPDARYTVMQKEVTTVQITRHVDMGASRLSTVRIIWPYRPAPPRSNTYYHSQLPTYLHHLAPSLAILMRTIPGSCQMVSRQTRPLSSGCSNSNHSNAVMVAANVHQVLALARRNVAVVVYDVLAQRMQKEIPI